MSAVHRFKRALGGVVALVLVSAVAGCGRASALPALYTGRVADRVTGAEGVTTEPALAPGYEVLGDVVSRCRADDGVVEFDGESLADVDCSDALLLAGLREKAASVGGTALVGLRCVAVPESKGELLASEVHSCSAFVAAATDAAPMEHGAARPDEAFAPPYASPREAFRVSVSVVPSEATPLRRKAISSDSVAELAVVPPGRVVVGDIVAACSDECGRAAVRQGVRAAAGRVGATDVVGISCVHRDEGWLCTGRATRPEIDEDGARARVATDQGGP